MIRFIAYAIATMVAALALAAISDDLLRYDSAESLVIFGLVAGLINAFIRPVVNLLTLPISCLTFGLFALVVNMVLFKGGAAIAPGIDVSWLGALVGSLLASVASGLIFSVIDD